MELAVLAAFEQEVVGHEAGSIPVVVPQRRRHSGGRQLPQLLRGATPVDRDDPVVVVTAAGVDEREAVGIDGDGPLDDVAGRQRREDVLAGLAVHEVHRPVVGAEHDPGAPVPLEHRRLARPAGTAPRLCPPSDRRRGAHATAARVEPADLRGLGHVPTAVVGAGRIAAERQAPGNLRRPHPPGARRVHELAVRLCRHLGGIDRCGRDRLGTGAARSWARRGGRSGCGVGDLVVTAVDGQPNGSDRHDEQDGDGGDAEELPASGVGRGPGLLGGPGAGPLDALRGRLVRFHHVMMDRRRVRLVVLDLYWRSSPSATSLSSVSSGCSPSSRSSQ